MYEINIIPQTPTKSIIKQTYFIDEATKVMKISPDTVAM